MTIFFPKCSTLLSVSAKVTLRTLNKIKWLVIQTRLTVWRWLKSWASGHPLSAANDTSQQGFSVIINTHIKSADVSIRSSSQFQPAAPQDSFTPAHVRDTLLHVFNELDGVNLTYTLHLYIEYVWSVLQCISYLDQLITLCKQKCMCMMRVNPHRSAGWRSVCGQKQQL